MARSNMPLALKARPSSEQDLGADVRVPGGLLEVGDGGAVFAGVVERGAEFEAELGIGRVLIDAALGFLDLLGEAVGLAGVEGGLEFLVVGIRGGGGFEVFQVRFDGAVLHRGGLGGERHVAVAERVRPVVEGVGVVPVFELFVDVGEVLDGGEVVGVEVVFLDDLVAAFFELLAGEAGAGGFFEFLELGRCFS